MRDDAGRETRDEGKYTGLENGGDGIRDDSWDETVPEQAVTQDESPSSGNVAGEFLTSEPIEPGSPDRQNALFVVVGAYIALLAIAGIFLVGRGLDTSTTLVFIVVTLVVTVLLLKFFGLITPDT